MPSMIQPDPAAVSSTAAAEQAAPLLPAFGPASFAPASQSEPLAAPSIVFALRPASLLMLAILITLPFSTSALAQAHPSVPRLPHADQRPGYLGVSLLELDPDTAQKLHLHDTHGALVNTIDRDAPAASAGLHPRDVIIELNGQRVDTVDALRRRLRDAGAGNTVSIRIARDGNEQSIAVRLGDQVAIAQRAWEQHFAQQPSRDDDSFNPAPAAASSPAAGTNFVPPHGRSGPGSSFLGVFTLNALYTGADLGPLSTQLAEYFGVPDGAGLLVTSVTENSPAGAAGLRAGDVILRVNNQPVVSRMDWTKQLHANRGRALQLDVMRNHHEQTLSMTAGLGRKE